MDWRDTIMTKQQQAEVWLRAEQQAGFLPNVTIEQILDDTTNLFFGESDQMHSEAVAEAQAEITWAKAFKAGEQKGRAAMEAEIRGTTCKPREAVRQEGRREVVAFAEKFLEMAEHGDYSNGNTAFGIDEGSVRAGELLDSYRKEWQAKLKEWGVEE